MIGIASFKTYFDSIVSRLAGIKSITLISAEADFALAIRNLPVTRFPAMLLIVPSADSIAATPDSVFEVSTCLLYIIQKVEASDQTPALFLEVLSNTQALMASVKTLMAADKGTHSITPHLTHDINLNAMHTDPEYNFFGCHGWSLSFTINNNGFL
ncbi:MAG: hypothetical protein WCO63_16070 [Bacteroidota bacterium]